MKHRSSLTLVLSVFVLILIAAGCGGGGEEQEAATTAEPASTEPASTEPASTEPASTEPASTEPASTEPAEKMVIGVLSPFIRDDGGYAESSEQYLREAIEAVGGTDRFEIKWVEHVPYDDQLTQTAIQLAQDGADVLFDLNASGQLFYDACRQLPDVACIEPLAATGVEPAPNAVGFLYERAAINYLKGVAAGLLVETGNLGWLSSFKAGYNTADLNSFALGCQSVKPDCVVRNIYINSFFDPPKTVEATRTLLDQGIEALGHTLDDSSGIVTAAQEGVWGFGDYADQSSLIPQQWVTGSNYGPPNVEVLTQVLQGVLDGTFTGSSELVWVSSSAPTADLFPWGDNVPETVRMKVEELLAEMRSGDFNPYCGPITDTSGQVRIPAGECIGLQSDFIVDGWDWFVEGVIGG